MGRHSEHRGLWFSPVISVVVAATAVFIALFLRHVPCIQTDAGNPINVYIRVCYSDIQSTFVGQGLGLGGSPLGTGSLAFPPLIAVVVLLTRQLAAALGAPVGPGADLQAQLDSSVVFFSITAVLLFVGLLIASLTMVRIGRGAPSSWDGVLVAGSPIVLASGLISWDLLAIAITLIGLLQFSRGRVLEGGIVMGIAACAGTMPIGIVLAVVVACGLRGGWRVALRFGGAAAVTFVLVQLPLMIVNFDGVYGFYHQEINKQAGYGSLWYLASLLGVDVRDAGSLAFAILVLLLAGFIAWLYVTGRRPRVGSLIAVVVVGAAILGPAYPPQTALWMLVALLLTRPYRRELVALTIVEVGYCLAVWGWIGGALTTQQSGPYLLYWLAIVLRAGVHVWIVVASIRDVAHPLRDAMRTPESPDPLGGVLNDGYRLSAPATA